MKKLGKLSITPEKVIKNEELVNLRGGYGGGGTYCCCCTAQGSGDCIGDYFETGKTDVDEAFEVAYDKCGNYNNSCTTNCIVA